MNKADKAREAKRLYMQGWRARNRERYNEYHKRYRADNKEQIAENRFNYWVRQYDKMKKADDMQSPATN